MLGHDHQVLMLMGKPDDMLGEYVTAGVPVQQLGLARLTGLATVPGRLRNVASSGRFDIVHGHFPLTSSIERLARLRSRFRYVFSHHVPPSATVFFTRALHRLTWKLVDHGVCVSAAVQRDAVRLLGTSVPTTVIDNGIDTRAFTRRRTILQAKREQGFSPDAPVVGLVASMRPEKRIDRWLQVAALVLAWDKRVQFAIVGAGPELGRARALAARLGIAGSVTFVGRVQDPGVWLEAMDAFLLTSDHEGFGIVVAEAMAMGVVPIVTAVGPLPEIVQPAWGVAAPAEPRALASAVVDVLKCPSRHASMAQEAVRIARERYDVQRMVRRYHEVYASLVLNG